MSMFSGSERVLCNHASNRGLGWVQITTNYNDKHLYDPATSNQQGSMWNPYQLNITHNKTKNNRKIPIVTKCNSFSIKS